MVPGHVPRRGQRLRCESSLGKGRIPGAAAPSAAAAGQREPRRRRRAAARGGCGHGAERNNLLWPAQLHLGFFPFRGESVKAKVFKQWSPGSWMNRAPSRKKNAPKLLISSAETIEVVPCWGCFWFPLSFLLGTWTKPLKKTRYSVRKTNAFVPQWKREELQRTCLNRETSGRR